MDDWQLLHEYAQRGSETAFRTLVSRHIGLVHSAAFRQVNDAALAQEITQAVFILLARKAASLPRRTILAGWLFRTTRFVAARALRSELRRQRREQEAAVMQQISQSDETWRRIAPELDEALQRLGKVERNAVLLRFFEDKNHHQVGNALGLSEEAAKKRVNRALDKLRAFFAGRGFTVSATVLGSMLVVHAAKAVPAGLVASVASGALVSTGAATTALPTLVREVLTAWRMAKLKLAAALTTVAVALVLLLTDALLQNPTTQLAARRQTRSGIATSVTNDAQRGIQAVRRASQRGAALGVVRLHVVAADTGEGVARAGLAVNTVISGKWEQRFDLATDDVGWCEVPYPKGVARLDVGVWSPGWGARYVTWVPETEDFIPTEYTLRIAKVTTSISGWLRDEAGKPVANAEVMLEFSGGGGSSHVERPRERVGFIREAVAARSDRDGHWSCALIPTTQAGFGLRAKHPEFATTSITASAAQRENGEKTAEGPRELWTGTLVTVLPRGVALTGRVVDETGQPISGAKVSRIPSPETLSETDQNGGFIVRKLLPGAYEFTVTADDFGPERFDVMVDAGTKPVEVRLKHGALLLVRVVDPGGAPLPEAEIGLERWRGRQNINWRGRTDAEGRVEWNSAPPGEVMEFFARKTDYCYTRDIHLEADGKEHTVELRKVLIVSGAVMDADTKQPIPEFRAIPGYVGPQRYSTEPDLMWFRNDLRSGKNGSYKLPFSENAPPFWVRIEAEGYEPAISKPLPPDWKESCDFELRRLDANQAIRGVVRLPDGSLAVGTQVALCTLAKGVFLDMTRLVSRRTGDSILTNTDAQGWFEFAPDRRAHSVVAVHESGFARVRVKELKQPVMVQLQPWGRIEGTLNAPGRSRAKQQVVLSDDGLGNYGGVMRIGPNGFGYTAETDEAGRFVFEIVPIGGFVLSLHSGNFYLHGKYVEIKPSQTTQVVLGSSGRRVIGQLALPEGFTVSDWSKHVHFAQLSFQGKPLPAPAGLTGDALEFWKVDFWQSAEAVAFRQGPTTYNLEVAPDGTFVADGVAPASYTLVIQVAEPENRSGEPLHLPSGKWGGWLRHKVEVISTPEDAPEEPLNLGTLTVPVTQE